MTVRQTLNEALIPMSVGELNQLMTYVVDGWMLFSAGFIGFEFVSFVSRRIQEDIEADAVALANQQFVDSSITETADVSVTEAVETAVISIAEQPISVSASASEVPKTKPGSDELFTDDADSEDLIAEDLSVEEAARLEEVAAVSEQLAKTKNKQSDSPSVSVST